MKERDPEWDTDGLPSHGRRDAIVAWVVLGVGGLILTALLAVALR